MSGFANDDSLASTLAIISLVIVLLSILLRSMRSTEEVDGDTINGEDSDEHFQRAATSNS